MSYSLAVKNSWENGYVTVALIQITLTAVLFFSLPIWRKQEQTRKADQTGTSRHLSVAEALKIKGVKETIMSFVAYSGVETTTGLWASSYLVLHRGIDVEAAARWASLFFLGITIGRFLSGFVSDRLGDRNVIRIGMAVITVGLMAVVLPIQINVVPLVGLLMIGLGCAPIYPSIIHQTPANFGEENSQAIIGIQVASAYVGSTFMPPIFGLLTSLTTSLYFLPTWACSWY